MAVPSVVTDLNVVAASNSPAGADTATTNTGPDDFLRALSAIIKREQSQGTALASASTVNIGASTTGAYIHITGTTTITAFDTIAAGVERTLVFDGALTLTHNATTLILPGGANITTAAGDAATFRSEGSGNWRCIAYTTSTGSSLGVFLQTGTGAVATTAQAKMRERFSVFDFMTAAEVADVLAGTLLVDVTTAFQAAMTAGTGRTLLVPAGSYLITAQLTGSNVSIVGEGRGVTKLFWDDSATTQGIKVEVEQTKGGLHFEGMSLLTFELGVGTALEVVGVGDSLTVQAGNRDSIICRDLYIHGDSVTASTDGWLIGIRFESVIDPRVEHCRIDTYFAGGTFYKTGSIGVEVYEPTSGYGLVMDSTSIIRAEIGVKITGSHEGPSFNACQMVAVGTGVYYGTGNPMFNFIGNHINFYDVGVHLMTGNDASIIGNIFYTRTDATSATRTAIIVDDSDNCTIADNTFKDNATADTVMTTVSVENTSAFCIIKNNILSTGGTGFNIESGVTDTWILGNHFRTAQTVAEFVDAGTDTRFSKEPRTMVQLPAVQLIADSVAEALEFGSYVYTNPSISWVIGTPTTLTINRTGKYVITVSVEWGTNTTGSRKIEILRNGTANIWGGTAVVSASSLGQITKLVTPPVELTAASAITVEVTQDSGSSINVLASFDTFVCIEEIYD